MSNDRTAHMANRILEEGKRLFRIFLYLWVLLGLFAIHKSLVLNEQDPFFHHGFAFINAWVLAKIMLTAEIFRVGDRLKDKPLIYPIAFKSAIFAMLLLSFHILEEVLVGLWHGKTIAASIPPIGGGRLAGMLTVSFIMFVALMPFFALREFGQLVGEGKLYELFFVRRTTFIARSESL